MASRPRYACVGIWLCAYPNKRTWRGLGHVCMRMPLCEACMHAHMAVCISQQAHLAWPGACQHAYAHSRGTPTCICTHPGLANMHMHTPEARQHAHYSCHLQMPCPSTAILTCRHARMRMHTCISYAHVHIWPSLAHMLTCTWPHAHQTVHWQAARDAEKAFFEQHPRYRSMASTQGTPYLARRLNDLLLAHIRNR